MINEPSTLLLVEDDDVLRSALGRAFRRRGYAILEAADAAGAIEVARQSATAPLHAAVVDLKLPGGSGLAVVEALRGACADTRIVVLTGYASIATAVEAIKLGATHYLTKPATPDEICRAFEQTSGNPQAPVSDAPPSVARLEWEHIQKVLADHGGNISATARALNMHRRTLQRKLAKHPVRR
jgi:two-component system, response regulator RegA